MGITFKRGFPFIQKKSATVIVEQDGSGYFFTYGTDPLRQDTTTATGQVEVYNTCPAIAAVINRKVRAHLNGKWDIVDSKGEPTLSSAGDLGNLRRLLQKPNPLQGWNAFEAQAKTAIQLHGECFIFAMWPEGFKKTNTKALYVIPNGNIRVKYSNRAYGYLEPKDYIEAYYLVITGGQTELPYDNIIHVRDINGALQTVTVVNTFNDFRIGNSRLVQLRDPISNIIAAYEARNVMITRRGAIGILSNVSKDATGHSPMLQKEIDALQEDFLRYGLNRNNNQVIITNAGLSWQAMTYPTKDLMLFEEIEDSVRQICDNYGYPMHLLGFKAGTTFSNVEEAKKALYQDTIIAEAEDFYQALNNYFGLTTYRLTQTYDHLAIFQQSELMTAQAMKERMTAYLQAYTAGLMTLEEVRLLGLELEEKLPKGTTYGTATT